LEYTDGKTTVSSPSTGRSLTHANNGVQAVISLKAKALYPGGGGLYIALEDNGVVPRSGNFGWLLTDTLIIKNAPSGTEWEVNLVENTWSGGIFNNTLWNGNAFGPILLQTSDPGLPASDEETADTTIDQHPQLVLYNKTLAEDPSRHPANAFKANTTYHFQYMYDETKIDPPKYRYWVLRIPAGLDAYNGENLL